MNSTIISSFLVILPIRPKTSSLGLRKQNVAEQTQPTFCPLTLSITSHASDDDIVFLTAKLKDTFSFKDSALTK